MNKEVTNYIEKQKLPQREICRKLREIIFNVIPNIKEEMKWGVPSYADSKYYMVALKDHVNLGFSVKNLSKEEKELFVGSGKTMKHIDIRSLKEIEEERITTLLKLVSEK